MAAAVYGLGFGSERHKEEATAKQAEPSGRNSACGTSPVATAEASEPSECAAHSDTIGVECSAFAASASKLTTRLMEPGMKFRTTYPGHKYEYEIVREYYWVDNQFVEVVRDTYFAKSRFDVSIKPMGNDKAALRASIEDAEQLHLRIKKPRRDSWKNLHKYIRPRGPDDMLRS